MIRVELTAVDPARLPRRWPVDGLDLEVEVHSAAADGPPASFVMEQTGPGLYAADVPAGGEAVGLVVRRRDGKVLYRAAPAGGADEEFEIIGPDEDALRRLAELTGGRLVEVGAIDALAEAWDRGQYRSVSVHALAAALLLMLLEWSLTRVWRRI